MTQHYVCRPQRKNIPEGPTGATLEKCQFCGEECWKLAIEPDPLPDGLVGCCTECAIRKSYEVAMKRKDTAQP